MYGETFQKGERVKIDGYGLINGLAHVSASYLKRLS